MAAVNFYKFAAAIMELLDSGDYRTHYAREIAENQVHNSSVTAQIETQTVETVAEHLTAVIREADTAKIAEIVEVLKEAEIIDSANIKTDNSNAALLVTAAVTQAAAETVEKIEIEHAVESAALPQSFWNSYREIKESEIRYLDAVRYLYGFAEERALFDYLNPNIDLTERRSTWTHFAGLAQGTDSLQSGVQNFNHRLDAAHFDQTTHREVDDRAEKGKRQTDFIMRQLAEQRNLEDRLTRRKKI